MYKMCYCCEHTFLFFFKNLPIERLWPEVNSRVNYPIKSVLVEMDNSNEIDMGNEAVKFCVSKVACMVAGFGLQVVISSWNEHPIAGISIIYILFHFI